MAATITVFLVDDNEDLRATVSENLREDGYDVLTAASAQECLEKLKDAEVDIVLLDLVLPDGNGLSLIRDIRKATRAPILVISGKNDIADKVVGLEMGADDYIGKPLHFPELSARIRAHLRARSRTLSETEKPAEAPVIRIGGWELDRARMQIYDSKGAPGGLTVREFRLLEALALAPNRVLSREQLLDATRGGTEEVFDRAIDIQITRIRRKIGDDAREPSVIKTVRGAGYMLVIEK